MHRFRWRQVCSGQATPSFRWTPAHICLDDYKARNPSLQNCNSKERKTHVLRIGFVGAKFAADKPRPRSDGRQLIHVLMTIRNHWVTIHVVSLSTDDTYIEGDAELRCCAKFSFEGLEPLRSLGITWRHGSRKGCDVDLFRLTLQGNGKARNSFPNRHHDNL